MSSKQKTPKKPKAAKEAERKAQSVSTTTLLQNVGKAAALLVLAGISSPVSQLNLSPVYGSIPASLHHQRAMTITALAALIGRGTLKQFVPKSIDQYIAVIAYWSPVVQFLLFPYSGQLGTQYGPMVTEGLTYFPFLFLALIAASNLLDCLDPSQLNLPSSLKEVIIPTASYFAVSTTSKIAGAAIPSLVGTHLYFTRIGFQMLIASASAFLSPSKIILFAFPAILHTLMANPHFPSDSAFQKANSTLWDTHNYTLLARQESLTGYVSVMESQSENGFRVLRCDHSLLGGEWLVTPEAYEKGQRQRETIFSVFVLLEAVRLVEPRKATGAKPVPDSKKSVLNIGLGIGTAPNAMIAHGINTTIVELDPVVHHYATKYFGLSPDHTAVINDAVTYVEDTHKTHPGSFDYIIHDVFTGGAEPVALFTVEFLRGLSALLADDGVIALNYAGDLSLGSTRLVLNTIHAVFPACRLFRDSAPPADLKEGDSDFINMVMFCIKGDESKHAIQFRQATQDDFMGSLARRSYLQPKPEWEVMYEFVPEAKGGKVMGKKDVGELEKYHEASAVNHWEVMRQVLPEGVWTLW